MEPKTSVGNESSSIDDLNEPLKLSKLKFIAVNVENLQNKHVHVLNLLKKFDCSLAVLSEVETSHSYAATAHMEGFRAFCPPTTVTGPPGKEVGVIMMVANKLAKVADHGHGAEST